MRDFTSLKSYISFIIVLLIITAVITLLLFGFKNDQAIIAAGVEKEAEAAQESRESYSFDLDKDIFSGKQNDQEIGDYQLCFYGDIESFTGITIGKGIEEEACKEWLRITKDKIFVYDADEQKTSDEFSHDLIFNDYIAVNIISDLTGKAKIEVLTGGGVFSQDVNWTARNGRVFVQSDGEKTVLKNCRLSYYCNGWDKDIWMYGDSYFSTTRKDRWTTYLTKKDPSDILLSGHDGEGSKESLQALKTQLQYGTPKKILWCVGMNDGDSKNEINKDYKDCLDEVIDICENNKIELIIATIPTCPYWFNDYKNEYIKGLGYTIIDFADAVGSYDSITWRDNMLEEGEMRIHPTEEGALALYSKAAATVPELLKHQ